MEPSGFSCSQGPISDTDCNPYCLFNIVNDPLEKNNIANEVSDKLHEPLIFYNKQSKDPRDMQDQDYHSIEDLPVDSNACLYMQQNGGYWQPWKT